MELPRIMSVAVMIVAIVAALLPAISSQGCGLLGQSCCPDLAGQRTSCNAGMWCDTFRGTTCQYFCGASGQPCCGGGYCSSGLFCETDGTDAAASRCIENCGQGGQRCCKNYYCGGGLSCNGAVQCVSGGAPPSGCGNIGQPCCGGDTCVAGTFCDTFSQPGVKTCQRYCGSIGQPCCVNKNAGYDGCNRGTSSYCDDTSYGGTGLCTNYCGQEGQSCCPRGYCSSGLFCNNAVCEKTRNNCGFINSGCCPDGSCALGATCVSGTCKQTCGLKGQKCCASPANWCANGLACNNSNCTAVAAVAAAATTF